MRVATRLAFLPFWRWIPLRIPASRRGSEAESIDAQVGMLLRALKHNKSAISARVREFGLATEASPPLLARSNQLMFLCGANRSLGVPSARREAIKKFIESLSPDFRVIYAEGVFNELIKIGHSKNSLDLEHEISGIADKILIVLESPSAFCELGAFAHQKLRKKLVIINDSQFRSESSFINTGPIAAATEAKAPVLWYPMKPDGIHSIDGIGATFNDLRTFIGQKPQSRARRLPGDISQLDANKSSLYFVHDLVFFAGPISHEELVELLKVAYGNKSYDMLKRLLGVLKAAGLIHSFDASGTWVYESTIGSPFMRYGINTNPMMALIRRNHLENHPSRFGR